VPRKLGAALWQWSANREIGVPSLVVGAVLDGAAGGLGLGAYLGGHAVGVADELIYVR
jgi:hypothetical protein